MGSDGIFDKLDNEDAVQNAWSTLDNNTLASNIHHQAGLCCDITMKIAMEKKSKDNVSSIFIGFNSFEQEYLNNQNSLIMKSKTIDGITNKVIL